MKQPDSPSSGPQRGGNNKGTRRRFGNIRRLPSKRFQASYTGPDGQRLNAPTTFQTKGDAEAWLAMQSAAITEARWKPAPKAVQRVTFADYSRRWLAERELKPRTRAEYGKMLTQLEATFGLLDLASITPQAVKA